MPWSIEDVDQFKTGLTDAEKRQWVAVANDALARCLAEGGDDCDAVAIRQANGTVGEATGAAETLGDKILEAVFDEGATLKATLQGFLKAAQAVTRHPNVPEKVRGEIEALRSKLASSTWAAIASDGAAAGTNTATATEATAGVPDATVGGIVTGDPQPTPTDGPESLAEVGTIIATFAEDGALVTAGGQNDE